MKCLKASAVKVNTNLRIKSAREALNIKHLWETRDCSHCRSYKSLIPLPDKLLGKKRLSTKGKDNLVVQMKGLRRPVHAHPQASWQVCRD